MYILINIQHGMLQLFWERLSEKSAIIHKSATAIPKSNLGYDQ